MMKRIVCCITILLCGVNPAFAQDNLCKNKIDDDGDGWIDNADPDCASGKKEIGVGFTECNDGIDNDGDGRRDSLDPHCVNADHPTETNLTPINPERINELLNSNRESEKNLDYPEFRFGVGVVAERWEDSAFTTIYGKSGKAIPTMSLSYRFLKNFSVDAEAGMGRLTANGTRNVFQVVPVTVGASMLFRPNDNIEPFVGVGAGFVQYSEQVLPYIESTTPTITYGTKFGVDVRGGVRVGTRFITTSQHPTAPRGPKQMDVELLMGKRFHHAFGVGTGLNMNSFRASIALKFRL